jgi:phage terminase large subunit GpA-like protein
LRVFVNSQLGQLWDYRPQKEMDKRSIWAIRDLHKYRRGVVPINGKFWLWLYIDVQEYFLPWAVYAQGPKDLALIDWGRVSGTADIETMLDRVWPVMGGRDASIDAIMIDSGFKTVQVYNWIRKNMRRVKIIPVKGQGEHVTQGELVKVSRMQSFPWINLHTLHRSKWHDMAGDLLAKLEPEEGQTILDAWESRSARLYLPQELDRDFVSELTAEVLMEEYDKKTGQTKRFYKRIRKNNHQFDLFRYALLTRHLMREDFNILKPDEKEVDPAQEKTEEIRQPKKVFDRYEEFDEDDNATYSEL